MNDHQPIRILSTRALGNEASDFIRHQDWLVDIVSMIETRGIIKGDQVATFLKDYYTLEDNKFLLFSSENGVKWLKWGIDKYGFTIPPNLKAVCVGEKTLGTAVKWLKVLPVLMEKNSTALLNSLIATFPAGSSFFFFSGNKRVESLPLGLVAEGFALKEFIIYETLLTPHKTVKDYEVILFFSPSAVESYFKVNTWLSEVVAISIGNTTAERLRQAGVEKIIISEEPSEMEMLKSLEGYLKKKG